MSPWIGALLVSVCGSISPGCALHGTDGRSPIQTALPAGDDANPAAAPQQASPTDVEATLGTRVVSEHYAAGRTGAVKLTASAGGVAAQLGGRVLVWDERLQPRAEAESFMNDVYLALGHDGAALAVAGRIGPEMLLDVRTGEQRLVSFERRWKYDAGLRQFAPSGQDETPWLGIDNYDVVLLDAALQRRGRLPRSKGQQTMVQFETKASKLDYMDPRQGDRGAVWQLRTTADGQFAVALAKNKGQRGRLIQWDLPQRRRLSDVALPRGLDPSRLRVSSRGDFALVTGWVQAHRGTRLYRVALTPAKQRGRAMDLGPCPYNAKLALSPDDESLLALSYRESAWWSLSDNQRLERGGVPGGAKSAVMTARHLIVHQKEDVHVFDRRTLRKTGALGRPGRAIRSVHRLDDGALAIASGHVDGMIYRWSAERPERLEPLGHGPFHSGVKAGRLVGLSSRDDCAQAELIGPGTTARAGRPLWKLCTQKRLWVGRFGREPRVAAVDFERDRVIVEDGPVFVVDGPTGRRTELVGSAAYRSMHSVSFSPGGRYVVANVEPVSLVPQRVAVWEARSGKLLHRLRVDHEFAGFPTVSGDEQRVAAAFGRQVHLLDIVTGRRLASADLPGWARWLSYDPERDQFVVHTRLGRRMFDAALQPVHTWSGWRAQRIEGGARLAFLASGERRLATLELTASGHMIYTPTGHYAASGAAPSHVVAVDRSDGGVTPLSQIPGRNDPGAVRRALHGASDPSVARAGR